MLRVGTEAFTVHDGDAAVIRSGYHPVVAAPGYSSTTCGSGPARGGR
ncbi:MAG: 5-deoxy-glucuronate isomerase [Candidatus Limnocylindrales bacterium]